MTRDRQRLLLIDDDDDIREVTAVALEEVGGFEILTASGGMAGAALACTAAPTAILLDVMMPQVDGVATFALLQAQPATRAIPVIFMTASNRPGEHDRLRTMGAIGVITKPYDPLTLPDLVKSLVTEATPC